eukprot:606545-Alexandrium_andersonii.AAC.1
MHWPTSVVSACSLATGSNSGRRMREHAWHLRRRAARQTSSRAPASRRQRERTWLWSLQSLA